MVFLKRMEPVRIPLTQGKFALVDAEDVERVNAMGKWLASWSHRSKNDKWYAQKTIYLPGLRDGKRIKKTVLMSRFLMDAPVGLEVDHKNHNTLDNQKENLRVCTHAENVSNRVVDKKTQSGFKGVYKIFNSNPIRFKAMIVKNREQILLGHFNSKEEAAKAYDGAAKKLFGEFAVLNFPDSVEGNDE